MSPTYDALVIGAGPSGLATSACLSRLGVAHTVLERAEDVGSAWRNHYRRLHLHTVKRFSHLPFMPFPGDYPRYVPRALFVEYLERYRDHFAIAPRFGQNVSAARRDGSEWVVSTQDATYRTRNLVVATGYNRRPKLPTWPGQEDFEGEVLHASRYRTGADYQDRRVLVVGMGNTGAEIGLDLVEQGAPNPALSVRGPVHVVPRDFMGIPGQWTGMLLSKVPRAVADYLGVRVSKDAFGDLSKYGIERPDIGPISSVVELGRIPVLDVGTIEVIKAGKLAVFPDIERFKGGEVIFVDGRRERFDVVVLATGYDAALEEFVDNAAAVTDDRGYPRSREAGPGLFFIGYRNPPTGALHDIAWEAQLIAAAISG